MKRMVMELWISDEAAEEMAGKVQEDLLPPDMVDGEKVLGARVRLPGGTDIRIGETFG